MTESGESNEVRPVVLGYLSIFSALIIGILVGGIGGYVTWYIAIQTYAAAYPASGWELTVMFFTCLSALFGMCFGIIGAWIAYAISKPRWWVGALIGGLVVVIGMVLWTFIESPDDYATIQYSDHGGYEGNVDKNHCKAVGWAVDPDDWERDLEIRILADDDPVLGATQVTYFLYPDIGVCQKRETCGFIVNLWGRIPAGEKHQITVQAFDLETESWVDLENSPKHLACWFSTEMVP